MTGAKSRQECETPCKKKEIFGRSDSGQPCRRARRRHLQLRCPSPELGWRGEPVGRWHEASPKKNGDSASRVSRGRSFLRRCLDRTSKKKIKRRIAFWLSVSVISGMMMMLLMMMMIPIIFICHCLQSTLLESRDHVPVARRTSVTVETTKFWCC